VIVGPCATTTFTALCVRGKCHDVPKFRCGKEGSRAAAYHLKIKVPIAAGGRLGKDPGGEKLQKRVAEQEGFAGGQSKGRMAEGRWCLRSGFGGGGV
jgi:hypothetical protein